MFVYNQLLEAIHSGVLEEATAKDEPMWHFYTTISISKDNVTRVKHSSHAYDDEQGHGVDIIRRGVE